MKETKIIIKSINRFQNTEKCIQEYQEELNNNLNNGYTIKASNLSSQQNFIYIYTLLENG